MKTIALLAAASLALVGCSQQDREVRESAGAEKDQIKQAEEAQKEALKQQEKGVKKSEEQAKEELSAQAKADKEAIESQAKSQEAQIEAQKKQVEAQSEAAKADVKAAEKIDEAAGAARPGEDKGDSEEDKNTSKQIRAAIITQTTPIDLTTAAKTVTIITKDGVVTLEGIVKTDAEKTAVENHAKAASGVNSVENKLEVKPE